MPNSLDDRRARQTSFYLVRRAEALTGALRFFDVEGAPPKLLQFLAQSDFWEWELDNLIYSFTNLAERQKTWRSPRATLLKLGTLGIAIDARKTKAVQWHAGGWNVRTQSQRVAPVELLRETIDVWNRVVDRAERAFVTPMQDKATKWNIETRQNLNSLRRAMPAELIEAVFEESDTT